MNTESADEFSCSYKGFRDCISSFRDNTAVLRDGIQKNGKNRMKYLMIGEKG